MITDDEERHKAEISLRLAILRRHLGLTKREMAEKLQITPSTLQRWERPGCRRRWTMDQMLKISKATDVSLDWLAYGCYPEERPSAVPLTVGGRRMPPRLRVVH
jgi:transcriptional regulator with XRE-family HTH domain